MWKSILAGTTALMIAGSSLVYAQEQPAGPDGARRWQPTAADVSAFTDARIARLKAGLKLTPVRKRIGRRWKARSAIFPSNALIALRPAPARPARPTRSSA